MTSLAEGESTDRIAYHESAHTLFLNALLFFLLLTLSVGVVRDHRLVEFADLGRNATVEVFELLGMLHDGTQVFL